MNCGSARMTSKRVVEMVHLRFMIALRRSRPSAREGVENYFFLFMRTAYVRQGLHFRRRDGEVAVHEDIKLKDAGELFGRDGQLGQGGVELDLNQLAIVDLLLVQPELFRQMLEQGKLCGVMRAGTIPFDRRCSRTSFDRSFALLLVSMIYTVYI